MERISPLLQSKIQQQSQVENINNQQPKIDLVSKPDTVELSSKKSNKKVLKIIAIVTGVLAAMTGGFILAKKGILGKGLQDKANNLWTNITKLFKKAPVQVENNSATVESNNEKIKELIKKEDLPFSKEDVVITGKSGDTQGVKYTFEKYSADYNGRDVVVEHKNVVADNLRSNVQNYAFIRDAKTGELVSIKPITLEGKERPLFQKAPIDVKVRNTEKILDEQGNKVAKTLCNGQTKAITTTIKNPDGSRKIIVNYGYGSDFDSDKARKKIIEIASDGTKKIHNENLKQSRFIEF